MIKSIGRFFKYLIETTELGFYHISSVVTKGFFFYFYLIASFFEKIFHWKIFENTKNFFKKRQGDPVTFLMIVLLFFVGIFLHTYLYVDKNDVHHVDLSAVEATLDDSDDEDLEPSTPDHYIQVSKEDTNLYRKYSKLDINTVNFKELKEVNPNTVAWLTVDGTSVNYPIVQGSDNDYYLSHDYLDRVKSSGWTYMDYRNHKDLSDKNTIFYGHNLLNKTGFGSLATIFTDKWYVNSNHYIVIRTETEKKVYQVFSCYYIEPEIYYLQTYFYGDDDYQKFLDTIKDRTLYAYGVDVTVNDKIITLSTCTDDSKGRKVVHAKLLEQE